MRRLQHLPLFAHRYTLLAFGVAVAIGLMLLAIPVAAQFPGGPGGFPGGGGFPSGGPGGTPAAAIQTAIASGTQPALPAEIQTAIAGGTFPTGPTGGGFIPVQGTVPSDLATVIASGTCPTPTGEQATAIAARGTRPAQATPPAEVQTAIAARGTVSGDLATAIASGNACAVPVGGGQAGGPSGFPATGGMPPPGR